MDWRRRFEMVRAELERGPASKWDIAYRLDIGMKHAADLLMWMHRLGLVHVHHWGHQRQAAGTPTRYFALGPGEDAPKPAPQGRRG